MDDYLNGKFSANMESFLPQTDMPIDSGIKKAVSILLRDGIETFESCEGGPNHAFHEPTVRFHGNAWAGYKAAAVAMENGLSVKRIQQVWNVVDGQLTGPSWEIVFAN